jgi:hypothetical protein
MSSIGTYAGQESVVARNNTATMNYLFNGLVVYMAILWMFVNYGNDIGDDPYDATGPRWFATVIPSLLFWILAGTKIHRYRLNQGETALTVMMVLATAMSLARGFEFNRAFEVGFFCFAFLVLTLTRLYLSLTTINLVFVLAVIAAVVTYQSGVSLYGFLPGQTFVNLHEGLWWRISVWNYATPPYSAAFALFVLMANLHYGSGYKLRPIVVLLCLYFIAFSASKTAYMGLILVAGAYILRLNVKFQFDPVYIGLPFVFLLLSIGIQFFGDAFQSAIFGGGEVSEAILIRDVTGDSENITSRVSLMLGHLQIMYENPTSFIFGIGDDQLRETARVVSQNDAFITAFLLRNGVVVLLFFYFIATLFADSMRERNFPRYLILLLFVNYALTYGGFLNFSNPVFLIFVGLWFHPRINKTI